MDLSLLERFLPAGREYFDRLAALERQLIAEAKNDKKMVRREVVHQSNQMLLKRKLMLQKSEKIDLMKKKLQKKIKEAKELINEGQRLGKFEECKPLE